MEKERRCSQIKGLFFLVLFGFMPNPKYGQHKSKIGSMPFLDLSFL
jgi:hypothetical protein